MRWIVVIVLAAAACGHDKSQKECVDDCARAERDCEAHSATDTELGACAPAFNRCRVDVCKVKLEDSPGR